jgi:hypothetical protein
VGVDAGGATLAPGVVEAAVAIGLGVPAVGSAATDSDADGVPQAASTTEARMRDIRRGRSIRRHCRRHRLVAPQACRIG